MAFSVDAFREAHRPWSFVADGTVWTARHVSTPAIVAFDAALTGAKNEAQRVKAVAYILRVAFPWRFSYLVRGDPVRILLNLEPGARAKALHDFFGCLGGETPSSLPQETTPGLPSSPPNSTA